MSFHIFYRSVIELIKSSPLLTSLLVFITIICGFFPLLTIYSVSMIVNCVIRGETRGIIVYSVIWVLSLSLPGLLSNFILIIQSSLSENMFAYLTRKLTSAINRITHLNVFENEEIHNDIDILKNNITNRPVNFVVTLGSIITSTISIMSISISMVKFSFFLPLLSLSLGIILFYLASKSQKELWSGSLRRNFQSRVMNYIFSLGVDRNAMQEIRIYNFNSFLQKKFELMFRQTKAIMKRVRVKVGLLSICASIAMLVISGLMALNILYLVSIGTISASALIFILQGIQNIQMGTRNASEQLRWLSGHLLFFEKYLHYTNKYNSAVNNKPIAKFPLKKIKMIELRNCAFNYGNNIVLENINITLCTNDIVAIVGPNGAGKTTLIRILMGLLQPTKGELFIDGVKLSEYGLENYWQKCSYVPQLFAQFKFTLKEAIFVGRTEDNPSLSNSFLMDGLPNFDEQLGKEFSGTDLSGGQWQKIAIMRSLVGQEHTDLLFFDEPTSAIDPIIEENIYHLIENISSDKITLYITHRMSTVTHANRILLIDKHRIVADGTHKELYINQPLYRKMFDSQAARFKHTL